MHVLSDTNGLPVLVGVSAGNTHDSKGLKPMVEGHQTRHDPHHGRYFKPQRLHADKTYDQADLRRWLRGKRIAPNYLAFLGLAAALCCYKWLLNLTM